MPQRVYCQSHSATFGIETRSTVKTAACLSMAGPLALSNEVWPSLLAEGSSTGPCNCHQRHSFVERFCHAKGTYPMTTAPDLDALMAEMTALKRRVRMYGRALAASMALGI